MKLLNTFANKKKLKILKADHIYLYDYKKIKYTDLTGGYTGHAILGWNNQKVIKAINNQAKKFCHIDYKIFDDPNREKLANILLQNKQNHVFNIDKLSNS